MQVGAFMASIEKSNCGSFWGAVKAMCLEGAWRFSRGIQIYWPRALRFPRESSEFWPGILLPKLTFMAFVQVHGDSFVYWESTAIQQILGGLVTWTRKKSSSGLQCCVIHVNGFNPTTMRKFGLLCGDCSVSPMQKLWMPNDMDSHRSKGRGGGWGVRAEEGLFPQLQGAPPPLLSPFALTTPVS